MPSYSIKAVMASFSLEQHFKLFATSATLVQLWLLGITTNYCEKHELLTSQQPCMYIMQGSIQ